MRILIITAMTGEMVGIRDHLTSVFKDNSQVEIEYRKISIGQRDVDLNTFTDLSRPPFDLIINAGTAGAISRNVQVQDIFFPLTFIDNQNQPISIIDVFPGFLQLSRNFPGDWKTGALFTSKMPVLTLKGKKKIAEDYCPDTVDMEAFTVASACQKAEVPFLSLKVISDTADSNALVIFKRNFKSAVAKLAQHLEILITMILSDTESFF